MSVLLDEETTTVVLQGLDFTERCDTARHGMPEHPAEAMTRFRCCSAGALLCMRHVKQQREGVDSRLAMGGRIICGYCSAEFTSYDACVEVVPL